MDMREGETKEYIISASAPVDRTALICIRCGIEGMSSTRPPVFTESCTLNGLIGGLATLCIT